MGLLDKMLHMGEGRQLKKLKVVADQVNLIEPDFEAMSDDELRGQTAEFKLRLENGESIDAIMPEAFGAVREATRRVLGKRHFALGYSAVRTRNMAGKFKQSAAHHVRAKT